MLPPHGPRPIGEVQSPDEGFLKIQAFLTFDTDNPMLAPMASMVPGSTPFTVCVSIASVSDFERWW